MYEISYSRPLPTTKPFGRRKSENAELYETLNKMGVKGSIFLEERNHNLRSRRPFSAVLQSRVVNYYKTHPKVGKFTFRTTVEDGKKGVTIWRVS